MATSPARRDTRVLDAVARQLEQLVIEAASPGGRPRGIDDDVE